MSLCSCILHLWEAVQVELRGRYSPPRFQEILQHAKQTSPWQHIGIMLLTPLPGLFLIVLMDVLPMMPPEDGVLHQSLSFHLRFFVSGWLMAHMMLMQTHASSPTIPLSPARHWAISLSTSFASYVALIVLGWCLVFPTPFSVYMTFFPWLITLVSTTWVTWRHAFALNPDAKHKVFHYVIIVFNAQSAMFFVYGGYTVAFNRIPTQHQTWFTLLLPIIKLVFKNWVIKGVVYMEDLAPTIIVFNVDVYHAIFVSSTTQGASTWGSVGVVMAIDVVQAVTAYCEVSKVFREANKLAIQRVTSLMGDADADESNRRTQSLQKLELGVIDYALDVINANPLVRSHLEATQPRYPSVSQLQSAHLVPVSARSVRPVLGGPLQKTIAASPPIIRDFGPRIVPILPGPPLDNHTHSPVLDSTEQTQLACVKGVLKMLHMIEFYVLIEFVEAIVPFMNAMYMRTLVYLPNRVYYWSLANLTKDELSAQADRMAIYASLELLSFVLFCYVMDRRLRHTSTYQILAFVLRKHARISQTSLTMWTFFIVQLGVQHYGEFHCIQVCVSQLQRILTNVFFFT